VPIRICNVGQLERTFPSRHTSSRETWPQNGHRFWVFGQAGADLGSSFD
jgi:hypothetical protein